MSNKELASPLGEAKVPLLLTPTNEDEEEQKLTRKVWIESKKLWHIVGPAIFSRIASYSMLVITQAFAGHLGDLELAAISIANNVVVGFDFGLLVHLLNTILLLYNHYYYTSFHYYPINFFLF
jgi:MATE family multidrug resistance protein